MAGKISELGPIFPPALANDDLIEVVDASDTSMAATGTNKKMTVGDLWTWMDIPAGGGGGGFAGATPPMDTKPGQWQAAPIGNYVITGLPGRAVTVSFGGVNEPYVQHNYRILTPFVVAEEPVEVKGYEIPVKAGEAGGLVDLAVYSVPSWRKSVTATLVAGSKLTAIDVATNGNKFPVYSTPLALPVGRYWLGMVNYGGGAGIQIEPYYVDNTGFLNAQLTAGNNSFFAAYYDAGGHTTGLPVGNFTVADGYPTRAWWVGMLVAV